MASAPARCPGRCPEEAHRAIERFLNASQQPILSEPGEEPWPLLGDNHEVRYAGGRLTLQVWNATASLTRRVTGVALEEPGRLDLHIELFARRTGTLSLLDLHRPKNRAAGRRTSQRAFLDRFRRALGRQFAGWRVAAISTEPDLQHSLSPAYARALLTQGTAAWATIGMGQDTADPDGVLTFGLLWLDHLRRRETRRTVQGLALFLPAGQEAATRLRLSHLNPALAEYRLYTCDEDAEQPVDLRDQGNVDTVVEDRAAWVLPPTAPGRGAWDRLTSLPQVQEVEAARGARSLRVHGLEFARWLDGELRYGLEERRSAGVGEFAAAEALARELARRRTAGGDRTSPLWSRQPELWLESQVRAQLSTVDATLQPAPVYGQVPAMAGRDSGILDLLAVDVTGRLVIVEIKAAEDVHLPVQALDYWSRVRWHQSRGEFTPRGYFPGVALSNAPPRCLLVAPALQFHPTTETLLQYLSPEVDVERVGLAETWRERLQVMFRLRGAQRPE